MATSVQLMKRLEQKKAKVEKLTAQLKEEKSKLADLRNELKEAKAAAVPKTAKKDSAKKTRPKARSSRNK